MGGHRAEYAREHLRAASAQDHNPHLVIWFGEATHSYWVAAPAGLIEVPDVGALLILLSPVPDPV